ncbi:twin-arginine translocation signal domain-containing protein [Rufibacter psychrotolerans]|uniref:twin-arginine translocation signal domain-containing protein n=1 Tax=Rufibacter psychrotolerans TaxID=2812556 RepID=UPI001967DAF2|nr:twin-arginine translocation signal domain-containing protein [Rufibacter sp. SYSU D00308]
MNRRNFLRVTSLAGAATIALPSLGYMTTSLKDAAVGVIINELNYLTLDRAGVEQFVDDYLRGHYINSSLKAQFSLISCYYLGGNVTKSLTIPKLVQSYLISTDFFLNKMDERRTIKYINRNMPYKLPCYNPFSALYYPQAAS